MFSCSSNLQKQAKPKPTTRYAIVTGNIYRMETYRKETYRMHTCTHTYIVYMYTCTTHVICMRSITTFVSCLVAATADCVWLDCTVYNCNIFEHVRLCVLSCIVISSYTQIYYCRHVGMVCCILYAQYTDHSN